MKRAGSQRAGTEGRGNVLRDLNNTLLPCSRCTMGFAPFQSEEDVSVHLSKPQSLGEREMKTK